MWVYLLIMLFCSSVLLLPLFKNSLLHKCRVGFWKEGRVNFGGNLSLCLQTVVPLLVPAVGAGAFHGRKSLAWVQTIYVTRVSPPANSAVFKRPKRGLPQGVPSWALTACPSQSCLKETASGHTELPRPREGC